MQVRYLFFLLLIICFGSLVAQEQYIDIIFLNNEEVLYGTIQDYEPAKVLVLKTENGHVQELKPSLIDRIVQMRRGKAEADGKLPLEEVLYLKNGSVFRGVILDYQQGDYLRLQLQSGDTIIVEEAAIQQIIQENRSEATSLGKQCYLEEGVLKSYLNSQIVKSLERPYAFQEKGWYNTLYLDLLSGRSEGDFRLGLGVEYTTGYQFNRWFGLGGGIAWNSYDLADSENVIPVFAEVRGYLTQEIDAPYYTVAAGYGVALSGASNGIVEAEGGYFFRPTIGYRFGAYAKTNVLLDLGYQLQKATFTRRQFTGGEVEIRRFTYQRWAIRFGLVF